MKNQLMPRKTHSLRHMPRRGEHPFDVFRRELDDLFDRTFRDVDALGAWPGASRGFEVSETDDEIYVEAELPGMDEKDIEVLLDEGVLMIQGQKKNEHKKKRRSGHVSEMSFRSFQRCIPMPAEVDRDKVKARFKRGVLTLTLPKTDQAKSARKRIPVSAD